MSGSRILRLAAAEDDLATEQRASSRPGFSMGCQGGALQAAVMRRYLGTRRVLSGDEIRSIESRHVIFNSDQSIAFARIRRVLAVATC
jgi:hypothetical protein